MKKDLFVIISGQVYSVENDDVKPFSGRGIEHIAKTIIKLEKIGISKRQATIIKHRSQPEGKKTPQRKRIFGILWPGGKVKRAEEDR